MPRLQPLEPINGRSDEQPAPAGAASRPSASRAGESDSPSWLSRYALALGTLAVTAGVRYLLEGYFHGLIPFNMFIPAAALAAWYGGLGPGLAVVGGGLVLGKLLFMPYGSREGIGADWGLILLYLITGLIIVSLFELLHRSRRRTQRYARRMREEAERRRKTEEALSVRESQLLAAARAGRIGFWSEDLLTGKVWWSPELEQMAGLAPGSFEGTREAFQQLVHPEDRAKAAATIESAIADGKDYVVDFRFVRPDGEVRWASGGGRAFRDGSGRVVRVSGVAIDVTEQMQARQQHEELLRRMTESERRYRSIGELIPYGFWMCDAEGKVFYVSQIFLDMIGMSLEEAKEKGWMHRLAPEEQERTVSDWQRCIQERRQWEYEHHIRGADGQYRTVMSRGMPVLTADGEVDCWVGIHFDITDRKRAEQALRESEERYRRLFELSPDPIVVHDGQKITFANSALLRLLGAESEKQVIGRNPMDFKHPDSQELVRQRIEHMRETGQQCPLVLEKWVKLDGTPVEVEVVAVPLPLGGAQAFQVLARDVTEKRRVDSELISYRERLEELVMERTDALRMSQEQLRRSERLASLGTLAAGIAHEINNPLNSIILTADYASQFPSEVEPEKAFETIIREAQRGGRIVKAVMKFARKDISPKSPHELNEVIRHAVDLARTYVHSTRLRLETALGSDLPLVSISPEEIEQVVINLLQNAVEAAKGEVLVKITTGQQDDTVFFRVEDNGPGISPENLQRIFDPFFSTRHGSGGTGLGLSICHSIVAEHGGTIHVQSALGEGTKFTVALPPARVSSSPALAQTEST